MVDRVSESMLKWLEDHINSVQLVAWLTNLMPSDKGIDRQLQLTNGTLRDLDLEIMSPSGYVEFQQALRHMVIQFSKS
jgi:hypothetical protein